MSAQNPRYIEAGLDPTEALVIASFMGWNNAMADAVRRGAISLDNAKDIVRQAQNDIETLMLDGSISQGNEAEAALSADNCNFLMASEVLSNNFERLASLMETEETSNVTAD